MAPSFIMVNDRDGDPYIIRTDLIEQVYEVYEPVVGAEEQEERLACIVLSTDDKEDEDDELLVVTSVVEIFRSLGMAGCGCGSVYNKKFTRTFRDRSIIGDVDERREDDNS